MNKKIEERVEEIYSIFKDVENDPILCHEKKAFAVGYHQAVSDIRDVMIGAAVHGKEQMLIIGLDWIKRRLLG